MPKRVKMLTRTTGTAAQRGTPFPVLGSGPARKPGQKGPISKSGMMTSDKTKTKRRCTGDWRPDPSNPGKMKWVEGCTKEY